MSAIVNISCSDDGVAIPVIVQSDDEPNGDGKRLDTSKFNMADTELTSLIGEYYAYNSILYNLRHSIFKNLGYKKSRIAKYEKLLSKCEERIANKVR